MSLTNEQLKELIDLPLKDSTTEKIIVDYYLKLMPRDELNKIIDRILFQNETIKQS